MNHLDIWQKVCRPPETALKKISGGRLSGMTDINPQWRYRIMTDVFGPVGIGWKYATDRLWTEPGPAGEVLAFAQVSLFVKAGQVGDVTLWSDPIPGIGGSMLIASEFDRTTEKQRLRANDEAYKMAITDALSVAMKQLGVAADIYERKWDGTKYVDGGGAPKLAEPKRLERPGLAQPGQEQSVAQALHLTGDDDPLLTDAKRKKLFALVAEHGVSSEDMKAFCEERWQISSRTQIRESMLGALVTWIKAHNKKEVA